MFNRVIYHNDTIYKKKIKLKRAMDILLSLFIIILILPLLIVIAFLIKISSKGEIIYQQDRVTKEGHIFKIYKFRTMYIDAEYKTGPIFAEENDQRSTTIGNFLRKISFDELPQLFNVIKGEMSLVGPRPERPYYVEKFQSEINEYHRRHQFKTGMTGLAQIKGLRGKTSIEERLKYDLKYIENYSLLLDLKIIYLTILIVLKDIKNILMSR